MSQLEFDFKMLSKEQEERVASFVASRKDTAIRKEKEIKYIVNLLVEAGFVEGVDFVNDFERLGLVTDNRSFGYGDDEFKTEVQFEDYIGSIIIKYQEYDKSKNKLVTRNTWISLSGDKLECSAITPQYRAYKPESLLTKLRETNEMAQYDFERGNKRLSVLNHTIEKYKTKYPNAEVGIIQEYNRIHGSFNLVQVKFESGSFISFKLGHDVDKEYIHEMRDTQMENMSTFEILNMFNKQPKNKK
tara:strand:+ start:223 stop:957 length:735 start_codon:yes stop_codon:yes gene_type:complete